MFFIYTLIQEEGEKKRKNSGKSYAIKFIFQSTVTIYFHFEILHNYIS